MYNAAEPAVFSEDAEILFKFVPDTAWSRCNMHGGKQYGQKVLKDERICLWALNFCW